VNLLTKTEQFDDAAWTKTNTTVTANSTTAPDGTTTADALFTTAATAIFVVGQNHTLNSGSTAVIYAKENTTGFLQLSYNGDTTSYANFNLSTGAVGGSGGTATHTIESEDDGWFKCTVVNTSTAVTGITWGIVGSSSATRRQTFTGTGAESIFIWGADLRVTNQGVNLPAYQRVNTSTDYDSTGFPVYIKPNGANQSMQTNSINFTATDKMTVWQGVRKSVDTAYSAIMELSTATANGSVQFGASSSSSGYYVFGSKGTFFTSATATNLAAPITNVITGIGDISGDVCTLRVNGAQAATSSADQGPGNYGNHPAYFYMRAGTSLPFDGNDYGSIARGAASTAAQITAGETYINKLTKAF
jgi:hypothetical protein